MPNKASYPAKTPVQQLAKFSTGGWGIVMGCALFTLVGGTRIGKLAAGVAGVGILYQLGAWLNQGSNTKSPPQASVA